MELAAGLRLVSPAIRQTGAHAMSMRKAPFGFAAGLIAALVGVTGGGSWEARAQEPSRAEQLIKYRQSIYRVLNGNFAPLAAMATGKAPFDAEAAAMRAERVAYLAAMLDEAYPADSQAGAPTRVKPEIWANRAEFDGLLEDMQSKTAELAKVAGGGDQAAITAAFGAAGKSCKACHDKFRKD